MKRRTNPDPADLEPLRTLADFAAHLGCHVRTARRVLVKAMQADPGLRVTRVGGKVMFTSAQFARTLEALAWRPSTADVAITGTRKERSASGRKRSQRDTSAQEKVGELTKRPRPSKAASAKIGRAKAPVRRKREASRKGRPSAT